VQRYGAAASATAINEAASALARARAIGSCTALSYGSSALTTPGLAGAATPTLPSGTSTWWPSIERAGTIGGSVGPGGGRSARRNSLVSRSASPSCRRSSRASSRFSWATTRAVAGDRSRTVRRGSVHARVRLHPPGPNFRNQQVYGPATRVGRPQRTDRLGGWKCDA
jgi:hypothetical protein